MSSGPFAPHVRLSRAVVCVEEDCAAVWELVGSTNTRCPSCGSRSWMPLARVGTRPTREVVRTSEHTATVPPVDGVTDRRGVSDGPASVTRP